MDRRPLNDVTTLTYQQWDGGSRVRNPTRMKSKTEPKAVHDVYFSDCCVKRCLNSFSMEVIQECRNFYWQMGTKQQRDFIYQELRRSLVDGIVDFVVEGSRVCEQAWLKLYGIADRRYRDIKKKVKAKEPMPNPDDIPRKNNPSRRHLQAVTWLTNYVKMFGDRQPDKEEFHLPQCLTKDKIYHLYKDEMDRAKEPVLSLSAFQELWLKSFNNVKISTGKGGHAACSTCTNNKALLLKKLPKELREKTLKDQEDHLNRQAECRAKYYKHIKKAKENPAEYVSLIIDGMDQAKTRLPRFSVHSKTDAHLTKIQHHITGVKDHGSDKNYIFTWTDLFHPNANITMNCLVHVLDNICKENGGYMPPTMYLQADNATKDNKNAFMMVFLAWLVKNRIFKKVKLSFLMVGHTHEDVDQLFSRVSAGLARQDAHTLPQLLDAIESSVTPTPACHHLQALHDYRGALIKAKGVVDGIMAPHHFKFEMNDDKVIMAYKDWPCGNEEYRQVDITKHVISLDSVRPAAINGKIDDQLSRMEQDLPKWADSGRLEDSEVVWWRTYIRSCKDAAKQPPTLAKASSLGSYKEPAFQADDEDISNLVRAVQQAKEKENRRSLLKLRR